MCIKWKFGEGGREGGCSSVYTWRVRRWFRGKMIQRGVACGESWNETYFDEMCWCPAEAARESGGHSASDVCVCECVFMHSMCVRLGGGRGEGEEEEGRRGGEEEEEEEGRRGGEEEEEEEGYTYTIKIINHVNKDQLTGLFFDVERLGVEVILEDELSVGFPTFSSAALLLEDRLCR